MIFQLTLKGEQSTSVSCIYFRKAETAQPSCHYRMSPCNCVLHVPVVYLPNIYLCYYLQAQLTCHDKFCKKFFVHVRTLCTRHSLRFFECLGTRLKHWTWEAKNLRPKTWDPCTQSFRAVLHSTAQYLLNFLIRRRYLPTCRIASFIVSASHHHLLYVLLLLLSEFGM